jgi:hypothetical protein
LPSGAASTTTQALEQEAVVVVVGDVLAGVAGRAHARLAAQGVHLEAGVVGQGHLTRGRGHRPRLEARVCQQRLAGLLRQLDAVGQGAQLDRRVG